MDITSNRSFFLCPKSYSLSAKDLFRIVGVIDKECQNSRITFLSVINQKVAPKFQVDIKTPELMLF